MKALKSLVTSKVVDAVVVEVEEKVATVQEGAKATRVIAKAKTKAATRDLEEVEIMGMVSLDVEDFFFFFCDL